MRKLSITKAKYILSAAYTEFKEAIDLEAKGTFFILIIVVAVLTLTLAALAGYIFLVQGNPANAGGKTSEAGAHEKVELPKDEELETLELYDGKQYFNLKNENDSTAIAILQVDIALQFHIAFKDDKKLIVSEKMEKNIFEIREIVGSYFMDVTREEAKKQETKEKAKEDLKKKINELLNEGEEKTHEYVYKVILSNWLYQ